jgi:uncharacterized protein YggE
LLDRADPGWLADMAADADRPQLVTSGNGEVERTADRAELRLRYVVKGKDRQGAVRELTKRIGAVEPHFERAGVEVRDRTLSVHDVWTGRRRSGAQAEQDYVLRVTDVSVLDDLVAVLVTTEPTSLDGPTWELADPSAAFREAQRAAVADARHRAEGYADALGARLGDLVSLTDGSSGQHHRPVMFARAMSPSGASAPDVAELSLVPQQVSVSADCTITWTLRQAD